MKNGLLITQLTGWIFYLSLSNALCTTVPNPSIRYTINNRTAQRVITFIQIESDDATFSISDTVRVMTGIQEGLLMVQSQYSTLKPYQRLIIKTDQRQYQTPILTYKDRCTAYAIQITQTGLSVREDYSFLLRRWAIELLVVCLFTLAIKGLPLLLTAAPHISRVYTPFAILNGFFIVCFLILRHYSFGRSVQAGPVEIKFYYLVLLVTTCLECFWYYNLGTELRGKNRLLAGAILGSLLWIFPGFLLTVFALFLFAQC